MCIGNNLQSVSVNELISGFGKNKICFIVPSYQRGYRWEDDQVSKLLDDIFEFDCLKRSGNSYVGNFYCLQPIIVKKLSVTDVTTKLGDSYQVNNSVDYYEIVDGQQRMTTVYILLKYILRPGNEPFEIEFERDREISFARKNLMQNLFNSRPLRDKSDSKYADEYYILQAALTIDNWFETKKTQTGKNNLISLLETCICDSVKVIWYELDQNADCYFTFKNINNGKIPLTDAELVKAMLLNSKHFSNNTTTNTIIKQEQDRYARLWDEIQKSLENPDLWSFITGGASIEVSTHIDFLIELIVKINDENYIGHGDHKFFSYFEDKLNQATDKQKYVERVFDEIRKCFRTLQDWNDDYEMHNYIGFVLTYSGKSIDDKIMRIKKLQSEYSIKSKNDFHNELIKDIRAAFNNLTLDTINYEDNRKNIEKLLMLFNIEELNELHKKFNFSVDKDGWSVEHIKAQHSEIVEAKKDVQDDYMRKEKESLQGKVMSTNDNTLRTIINQYIGRIDNFTNDPNASKADFELLAEEINHNIDGFDTVTMHKLGNLALIAKADNSSLGNEPFYAKREKLNQWTANVSQNIPNSTQKAFHKMYSSQKYALDFTRWCKQDFDDMFARQKELLKTNDTNVVMRGFIREN